MWGPSSVLRRLGPIVRESELQGAIIEMAQFFGWLVAHFRTSLDAHGNYQTAVAGDGSGFPDLVLVREGIIFAELKVRKNKLSYEQEMWRDAIITAGGNWVEWREGNWTSGEIEGILR